MKVSGNLEQAALAAGSNLSDAESTMVEAFGLKEGDDLKAMARRLGVKEKDLGNVSIEGLQQLAKSALDRASSSFELLSQLLAARKKTADVIIGNIR